MDESEVRQVADFLVDCQQALWEQDGTETMLLYLHRLYDVACGLAVAAAVTDDENLESTLRMMSRKAQTLRRQMEERLGVRN